MSCCGSAGTTLRCGSASPADSSTPPRTSRPAPPPPNNGAATKAAAPFVFQPLHRRQDADVTHRAADAANLRRLGRLAGREIDAVKRIAGHQPGVVLAV